MSSLEIYGVRPDGDVVSFTDLRNSWRGAALVWSELGTKYLSHSKSACLIDDGASERVWKLVSDPRLTEAERVVLLSTFDGVWIPIGMFPLFARSCEEFARQHPDSHYATIPSVLERMRTEGFVGYCANQTSVCSNPWWISAGEDDEGRRVNVTHDERDGNGSEIYILEPNRWLKEPAS